MEATKQDDPVLDAVRALIRENEDKALQAKKTLHLSGWFVRQAMKRLSGKASPYEVHSAVVSELVTLGAPDAFAPTNSKSVENSSKSKIARLIDPGAGWDRRPSNSEMNSAEQHEADLDRRQVEAEKIADRVLAEIGPNSTRSAEFLAWAKDTYGSVSRIRVERLLRFVEEAIQLAHADGIDRDMLITLLDRVYSRPKGEINQEIAQTQVCLEMYAENIGESSDQLAERERQRIQTIPKEEWQRRNAIKQAADIAVTLADSSPGEGAFGYWAPSQNDQ